MVTRSGSALPVQEGGCGDLRTPCHWSDASHSYCSECLMRLSFLSSSRGQPVLLTEPHYWGPQMAEVGTHPHLGLVISHRQVLLPKPPYFLVCEMAP